jgi:hypothetical protein
MNTGRHRIAILLAALYGLSITTSVSFHNHGPCGGPAGGVAASPASNGHACGHCGVDHRGGHPTLDCRNRSADEGGCFVCQFLAQKPIPADPVTEVASASLLQRLVRVEPIRLPCKRFFSIHSRAPPAAV